MKTLVLGSEGFIGRPFCDYLRRLGEDVVGIDIKNCAAEDLRLMRLSLQDVQCVYFLAWDVGGAKYLYKDKTQQGQLDWNLKLLMNVMPQLRRTDVPFLFISSQLAEYPNTAYGVTKRLGEVWTGLIGGACVRLWNVYGPLEEPSERSHVVSDFVCGAVRGNVIKMMTTGEEMRQFVHIDDVCRALHVAMKREPKGVYDVTSTKWVSILDVAELISRMTGAVVEVGKEKRPDLISYVPLLLPGWTANIGLSRGIAMMLEATRNG